MKCKERIIPDEDRIDTMGIIKLIDMDLEEIRKNYLIADGSITIFLSERLIFRLVQWKCKWMDLGYININYTVEYGCHKDLDVDGQIFGCEIRLLHQWEMEIANAYRIQFEEVSFIPLNPGAPGLAKFHQYIDPSEWKWSDKGLEDKSMTAPSNFYSKELLNSIYGATIMSQKEIDYALEERAMDYVFLNNNYIKRANGKNVTSAVNSYFDIEKVIFNGPATIVVWKDGTKTIVKCEEGTTYSKEEAIDQAILKKLFTTNSHHKRVLKDLISEKSVEQIDKKKLKKGHTNYIQEAVADYINGKTEE